MDRIPLMVPNVTEEDIAAVVKVLRSGNLVQGENVAALEYEVAEYLGVKHVVAVSNGTASLHLALIALGVGPGDEVIVPAFSFVATANVVEIVGAKCVFVDIDLATFNIDVSRVEEAITPRTKAIIPVHEFGLACEIADLMAIARKHGLFVIEDAACALGATENGRLVGTFGDVGSFSLHPRKAVTSGEGGFIVTDNDELAKKFRILRNHGIELHDGKIAFTVAGFNYRMTDFQAALVRGQFARIDAIISYRQSLASLYQKELGKIVELQLPVVPEFKGHAWQTFHVVVCQQIDRDFTIRKLSEKGIGSNYGAQCIPLMNYYHRKYRLDCESLFPGALRAYEKGLALPMYDLLKPVDVTRISREFAALLFN
jgi:dTDP-4-amino-4,6-dideoxygalactose transaminase